MPHSIDHKRRSFLKGRIPTQASTQALPWLKSLDSLIQACTQCGKCITACPQNIIEKSDGGFPRVNFQLGECDFCYQCADNCPESLFTNKDCTPWNNMAKIDNTCLALNRIYCQGCREVCPEEAIIFKPALGGISRPEISLEDCIGCGACITSCPADAINIQNLGAKT